MDTTPSRTLILNRLQRLVCLSLEGTPGDDVIEGTGAIWLERLEHFSPSRLKLAFDAVEIRSKRWPTPADIIECLPTYPHTWEEPPPTPAAPVERQIAPDHEADARIEAARQRRREEIKREVAECAKRLGVTLPPGTFGADPCASP